MELKTKHTRTHVKENWDGLWETATLQDYYIFVRLATSDTSNFAVKINGASRNSKCIN